MEADIIDVIQDRFLGRLINRCSETKLKFYFREFRYLTLGSILRLRSQIQKSCNVDFMLDLVFQIQASFFRPISGYTGNLRYPGSRSL